MTVHIDNPAGRLHQLLTSFSRNASSQPTPNAWAAALGLAADSPDLLRRLGRVFNLPEEIQAEIFQVNEAEYDGDLALRWQESVRALLALSGLKCHCPSRCPCLASHL